MTILSEVSKILGMILKLEKTTLGKVNLAGISVTVMLTAAVAIYIEKVDLPLIRLVLNYSLVFFIFSLISALIVYFGERK